MTAVRVAVIGAGAVGLACARELARDGELFVLESAPAPGWGVTSRNSEVVHAGLYYPPGSLKARLCVEGRERLYAYLGDGARRCGKLVVAVDGAEVAALEALHANALACGVDDVEILSGAEVRRREPAVRCVAALSSPSTGILDAHALVRALRADVERAGGTIVTHATVVAAERATSGYRLTIEIGGEREPLECDMVVNAAGLWSDRVARMVVEEGGEMPAHHFVRGSYARLRWPRGAAVPPPSRLVYPLPNVGRPGLGIHLTVDMAGGLRLGPDAEPLPERVEDYRVDESILPRFEAAARRYLDLPDGCELTPDFAGIRPVRADGSRDFYVAEDLPGWVNLIGIESPGLTASLALARLVAIRVG